MNLKLNVLVMALLGIGFSGFLASAISNPVGHPFPPVTLLLMTLSVTSMLVGTATAAIGNLMPQRTS